MANTKERWKKKIEGDDYKAPTPPPPEPAAPPPPREKTKEERTREVEDIPDASPICFLFPCALLFCVGSEMTNAQLSHRLLSKSEPINSREFSEQFKISSEIQQFPKQSSAQMISRINCFPAKML